MRKKESKFQQGDQQARDYNTWCELNGLRACNWWSLHFFMNEQKAVAVEVG